MVTLGAYYSGICSVQSAAELLRIESDARSACVGIRIR